jgi:hypothetical protein
LTASVQFVFGDCGRADEYRIVVGKNVSVDGLAKLRKKSFKGEVWRLLEDDGLFALVWSASELDLFQCEYCSL